MIGTFSSFFNISAKIIKIISTQVRSPTMKGAKFAYPKGIGSKYENVFLILSSGLGANMHTAP